MTAKPSREADQMNWLGSIIHLVLLYLFLGVIVTALRPTPRSLIRQCLRHESQRFNKTLAVLICCIISLIAVALWPIIWITNIRAAAAVENLPPNKEQLSLFGGGNGDSFETAVVVNAHNSLVGIEAEYAYIANQCGEPHKDWKLESQGLREHGGKPYDVLTIALSGGATRTFYFDITNFFTPSNSVCSSNTASRSPSRLNAAKKDS